MSVSNKVNNKDKNSNPICPEPDDPTIPGFCAPELPIDNVDTRAIMAGGHFFSDKDRCNREFKTDLKPQPQPQAKAGELARILVTVRGTLPGFAGLLEEGQYVDQPEVGPPEDLGNWGPKGSQLGRRGVG